VRRVLLAYTHVQKPNTLAAIFDLAVEARADHALWESEHEGGAESWWRGMKSVWREVETRKVGSEVARFYAFCRLLTARPGRPGRYLILKLKLIVGRLELRFSPVPQSKRKRRKGLQSGRIRALNRKNWSRLRSAHRLFKAPYSAVPLVRDDAELRALLALRCMQQNYHADAAYSGPS